MSEQRVALEILRELHSKGGYEFPFELVEQILRIESQEQYSSESDKRVQKVENLLIEYVREASEGMAK